MTVELKKESESLNFDEQGELAAFLIQLRNRHDPDYVSEMQRRIEDNDPSKWLTPDEFDSLLDE